MCIQIPENSVQKLIHQAYEPVFIVDASSFKVLYSNEAASQMSLTEGSSPGAGSDLFAFLEQVRQGGRPHTAFVEYYGRLWRLCGTPAGGVITVQGADAAIMREMGRRRRIEEGHRRHDMRGLVGVMVSLSDYAAEICAMPEASQLLQKVTEAGEALLADLDFHRDMHKVEDLLYVPVLAEVPASSFLRELLQDSRARALAAGVDVAVQINGKKLQEADPAVLFCEKRLALYMMQQILRNAIEAAPRSTVVLIDVQTEGHSATVVVTNAGHMPPELRERVFRKYCSDKAKHSGTGAYHARLIAQLHGGDITVDDCEDSTNFIIRIPLVEE